MLNLQLIPEIIILGSTLVFILVTIIFALIYYKKIFFIKKEYEEAKNVITGFILTFKNRQNEQNQKINKLTNEIGGIYSSTEKLTEKSWEIDLKINNLLNSMKSVFMVNRRVIEHISILKNEINKLSKTQQEIQKQLTIFEEKSKIPEAEVVEIKSEVKAPLINLTETENQVINFLLNEGKKTAPEVEKKIGKTREHTARLMKKLWQEGFIERDTHRVPFTYRANEKLKERLETKIDS